jgi:hypothetical protein
LNPIGFSPDFKLSLDATITGQLDTHDVTSAVLMISNRSKTLDVTKVTITQPEVAGTYYEINGKPARLSNKAQYVKPSDKEYKVTIDYNDTKNHTTGTTFALISTPLPKEIYWLYVYRTAGGDITIGRGVKDPDESDTGAPPPVDPNDPEAGEGSVPGVVPPHNRDRMGVLVVLNMTKDQDLDYVDFNTPVESTSPNYKLYRMAGEPKRGDQQSIALGHASWRTTAAYTPAGGGQRFTGTKNSVVMPVNDPMSLRTNFMYFYKTRSGGYELTPVWPPLANDADDNGNYRPEDLIPDGYGWLQVTNKSETGKVIYDIMIDGNPHENVMLAKDDMMRFTLPVNMSTGSTTVQVALRPQGQSYYGLTLPRVIRNKEITYLNYYDNLGNPDELPPDTAGNGTGLIKILNYSLSVATDVKIVDPANTGSSMTIGSGGFTPPIPVNYNQTGRVGVVGTDTFPLEAAKSYLIEVTLKSGSVTKVFRQHAVIRDQIVTIKIYDRDLVLYNPSVYMAGTIPAGIGWRAVYWKNGVMAELDTPTDSDYIMSEANAITTSGGRVYVAGWYRLPDVNKHIACYWRDGARIDVELGDAEFDAANDIFVSGDGTVYMAGTSYDLDIQDTTTNRPCYWINTTKHILSMPAGYSNGQAQSITVSGGKVYVAGFYGNEGPVSDYTACYWVDGERFALPSPSEGGRMARTFDIAVSGNDIYVSGSNFYYETETPFTRHETPCYWKVSSPAPAVRTELPLPSGAADKIQANAIVVAGGDVYVTGHANVFENYGGDADQSYYWKNGSLIPLPAPGVSPTAHDITLYDGTVYVSGAAASGGKKPCYWKNGVLEVYNGVINQKRVSIAVGE